MQAVKWGEYRLVDLFEINPTKYYRLSNEEILFNVGDVPLVSNQFIDNGVMGFSSLRPLNKGNTITCSDTTVGADTMFYQENDFIGYSHIQHLVPKFEPINKKIANFIITSCRRATLNQRYDYGHKFNREAMNKTKIQLPVKNGKIDFEFMEQFVAELESRRVAELESRRVAELEKYLSVTGLKDYVLTAEEEKALSDFNDVTWGTYKVGDLFEQVKTKKLSYKAKDLPKSPFKEYVLPALTSSFQNQGLNYYVPIAGATVLNDVISLPSNSDVYRAYYQSREFTVLSDAYAIRWRNEKKSLSPRQYLFFVRCINKVTDLPIYSYKNKLGGWNTVKNKEILIPIKNGEIDYDFMEKYISAIQKLVIKDFVLYTDSKIKATKAVI